jgi:hypothetical protein
MCYKTYKISIIPFIKQKKSLSLLKLNIMKKISLFILFFVLGLSLLTAQNSQVKKSPVGTWKFEAPYAPEGFTSGTIVVAQTGQNYTTTLSFTGNENKITGDKVRLEKDSLLFSVYIQGEDVKVIVKIEEEAKMSGKAVYSQGEVPFTISRKLD